MSASTITIRPGQLARCSPDFHITRGLAESHTLTLLNSSGTAYDVTGITGWVMQVAQDFLTRTPPLAESETILSSTNTLPVTLNANTTELRDFMDGKTLSPVFASLIGLDSAGVAIRSITFRIIVLNSNYNPEAEPTPVQASQFYTAAQVDAKFADIGSTLNIPSDINELDDEDGLISSKVESVSALPTPAVGILNRAYFLTADDGTKKAGTTWKCVADGETYNFQQIQTDLSSLTDTTRILPGKVDKVTGYGLSKNDYTDAAVAKVAKIDLETLTELAGADVTVAPWTQSKWSASGTCTLTATGWAASGRQTAYIIITLAAGATPSIIGTEAVEDGDALSAAGVYECFLKNVDGKIYFHQISFTEAAA